MIFFGVPTQTFLEMAGSTSGLLEEFCTPGGLVIVADPTVIGLLYMVFFWSHAALDQYLSSLLVKGRGQSNLYKTGHKLILN